MFYIVINNLGLVRGEYILIYLFIGYFRIIRKDLGFRGFFIVLFIVVWF